MVLGAQSGGTHGFFGDDFEGTGIFSDVGGHREHSVSTPQSLKTSTVQDCEFSTNGFGVQIYAGGLIAISNSMFAGNFTAGLWFGWERSGAERGAQNKTQKHFRWQR